MKINKMLVAGLLALAFGAVSKIEAAQNPGATLQSETERLALLVPSLPASKILVSLYAEVIQQIASTAAVALRVKGQQEANALIQQQATYLLGLLKSRLAYQNAIENQKKELKQYSMNCNLPGQGCKMARERAIDAFHDAIIGTMGQLIGERAQMIYSQSNQQ